MANKFKQKLSSVIRLEFKGILPALVIHEKYEKSIKWILRLLTVIGILSSLITIDRIEISLIFSILLLLLERFLEKAVLEYTSFVLIPLPEFEIDYNQWITNGFLIPKVVDENNISHIGPTFKDKDYAEMFFDYLTKWNWDSFIDEDESIVLSIVIENKTNYSMYIYNNPDQKQLDKIFKQDAVNKQLSKYGKRQQQLYTQLAFWKKLEYDEKYFIHQFLSNQKTNTKFYLTPSILPQGENSTPEFLFDYSILKFNYRLKYRNQITKNDLEYYLK